MAGNDVVLIERKTLSTPHSFQKRRCARGLARRCRWAPADPGSRGPNPATTPRRMLPIKLKTPKNKIPDSCMELLENDNKVSEFLLLIFLRIGILIHLEHF